MAGGVYLLGRLHLALTGMRVGERSSYTGSSFPGGRQRNAARHAMSFNEFSILVLKSIDIW